MAKADKTYVYKGQIYLPGAEMPEDWQKPEEKGPTPGVRMFGPEGELKTFPEPPLPPGMKKLENVDESKGENAAAVREEAVAFGNMTETDKESGLKRDKDSMTTGKKPASKE